MNSKRKGKVGELELVTWLKARGLHAQRTQQYKGTPNSADVECQELKQLHIEVKRRESGNVYRWVSQAVSDAGSTRYPIVFHRRSRSLWHVTLRGDDFIAVVKGGSDG